MKLKTYLDENKLTVEAFAASVRCAPQTLYRYISGERRPRADVLSAIRDATGGKVTANDFFHSEAA